MEESRSLAIPAVFESVFADKPAETWSEALYRGVVRECVEVKPYVSPSGDDTDLYTNAEDIGPMCLLGVKPGVQELLLSLRQSTLVGIMKRAILRNFVIRKKTRPYLTVLSETVGADEEGLGSEVADADDGELDVVGDGSEEEGDEEEEEEDSDAEENESDDSDSSVEGADSDSSATTSLEWAGV